VEEPRTGDAFGELLLAARAEETATGPRLMLAGHVAQPVVEVVEWDDGMVNATPAARYLAAESGWLGCERRALLHLDGPVLDVGCGAGRLCLALQGRGVTVTGLDPSPGAVAVARDRGVRDVVCGYPDDHADSGRRYRTFAFFGANLGLLASRERAPVLLGALAAMATTDARIVGQGVDPYRHAPEELRAYHARNRARGRLPGQMRMRVRFLTLATPWTDFLLCSVAELERLLDGTDWRLTAVDDADAPMYSVVLRRR
jgi:SAM-dependent methyltransferase